ncbi:putative short-chain type dehydrogenase/reductase [Dietzia sp. NCCP-2495]|nr:putative short-chain type dehydrogenase/reductase [Dietzia sp. NCCP-2495]
MLIDVSTIGVRDPGPATEADLQEAIAQVEPAGGQIVATKVDVRDYAGVEKALREGLEKFGGRLDVVSANAGIFAFGAELVDITDTEWDEVVDTDLKGVFHTVKTAGKLMIEAGNGGSVIITSSAAGIKGTQNVGAYTSAKHAIVGLMKTAALELGRHHIRVNTLHPTSVRTKMILNDAPYKLFLPDVENPTIEQFDDLFVQMRPIPVAGVESEDVTNALMSLASDEARYFTGAQLKVDAGFTLR